MKTAAFIFFVIDRCCIGGADSIGKRERSIISIPIFELILGIEASKVHTISAGVKISSGFSKGIRQPANAVLI